MLKSKSQKQSSFFAKTIVSVLFAGFAISTGAADAPAKKPTKKLTRVAHPFLWTIERDDGVNSYLFGTIHIPREEVTNLPARVQNAFDESDAVFVEIPMDGSTMMRVQTELYRTDGKSLEEDIGKEWYRRADKLMMRRGMTIDTFNNFKTSGAAVTIGTIDFMKDMAMQAPLDMKLFNDAVAADKEVGGVETVDEQVEILFNMEDKMARHLFEKTIEQLEEADKKGESFAEMMIQTYLTGDADALMKFMTESYGEEDPIMNEFLERLLDKRNRIMAKRIDAMLRKNPQKVYFFALGAAHMPGDVGVVKLLEDRGWKISRIEKEVAAPATP